MLSNVFLFTSLDKCFGEGIFLLTMKLEFLGIYWSWYIVSGFI